MAAFTDFESLYEHLEKNAVDYKYSHQIGDLFRQLRDLKHKESKSDEAEKAQWEVDFFNFTIQKGKLNPMFTGTNEKGESVEYPNLGRFNERTYEYLIARLDCTHNLVLKARYFNILWCSPKKHAKFAEVAAESYLELVKIYESKDSLEPQEHWGLSILEAIENAYYVSCQAELKTSAIKSEIKRLVTSFNFESSSSFALRASLIRLMLKEKERFSNEDFVGLEEVCWQMSEALAKSNIHGSIDMLELGEKIDHKLEKKTYTWRKHVAELYETMMKQREKPGDLGSLYFCQKAIENYRKINDIEKVKELEKKYLELKESVELKEFKTEIDLTEHVRRCREIAEKLVQKESDEIIKILMLEKKLLPKHKDMEKLAEEQAQKFPLQHIFPTEIIDQTGHPAQHFSDEEEMKYLGLLNQYQFDIELNKIHLINEIFFAAIREGKLSTNILLKFLNKHSWFGKTISKKLSTNETIEYNWLSLIAPALHEYFSQMQRYLIDAKNHPNLVLSIDSLTLKIEGLLRDICIFSGVTTFYMTQDSKGRNIIREKDVHALLYEEQIKKLFDEDDLLFFKFLLVEKAGYNLRHRIAHSLMLFQEYTIAYMHLLILALLKLGKYDFVKKQDITA
jgi:hypothetical protein